MKDNQINDLSRILLAGLMAFAAIVVQVYPVDNLEAGQKAYHFVSTNSVDNRSGEKNISIMRAAPEWGANVTWRRLGSKVWFPRPLDNSVLSVGNVYSKNVVITGDGYPPIYAVIEMSVDQEIEMLWGSALFCLWKIKGISKILDKEKFVHMRSEGLCSVSVSGDGAVLLSKNGFIPEAGWMDLVRTGQPDIWASLNCDDVDLGSHSVAWAAMR